MFLPSMICEELLLIEIFSAVQRLLFLSASLVRDFLVLHFPAWLKTQINHCIFLFPLFTFNWDKYPIKYWQDNL